MQFRKIIIERKLKLKLCLTSLMLRTQTQMCVSRNLHTCVVYPCVQGLLKQTEAEHPDYYLLLVCIQQFRSFTAQYHHLLQHNQELLLHNRKEVKRSGLWHPPDF